jgi:hypothetical protein
VNDEPLPTVDGDDREGAPRPATEPDAVDVLSGVDAEPLAADDTDDDQDRASFVGVISTGSAAPTIGVPADATAPVAGSLVDHPTRPPSDRVEGPAPMWGPRPHPAPVQAPPPPPPLAAPVGRAAPSASAPSPSPGSAAVVGSASRGPAPIGPVEAAPLPATVAAAPALPRVRRWFGRSERETPATAPTPGAPSQARRPSPAPPSVSGDPSAPTPALDPVLPPEPDMGDEVVDPWSLGTAVARMSAAARQGGAVSLGILSTVLVDGEVVEVVVQGTYQNRPAVVALTDRRVVVVNERRWRPDVRSIDVTRDLVVQGWQDERQATLVFAADGRSVVVTAVEDRPLARDLARQVREKVASRGGPPVPGL